MATVAAVRTVRCENCGKHNRVVFAHQPGAAPVDVLRRWLQDALARLPVESRS